MLVVVGEFTIGKSAFTNALVDHEVAAEALAAHRRARDLILKHSPEPTLRKRPRGVVEKRLLRVPRQPA